LKSNASEALAGGHREPGTTLSSEWKGRLGLAARRAPEYYETSDAVVDTPHALAIRIALDELGLSAIFCVQGVPTIAILNLQQFDASRVVDLHGALWNQGLASLLLVVAGTRRAPTRSRENLTRNGAKNSTSAALSKHWMPPLRHLKSVTSYLVRSQGDSGKSTRIISGKGTN